jgi:GAF domain-containing protein
MISVQRTSASRSRRRSVNDRTDRPMNAPPANDGPEGLALAALADERDPDLRASLAGLSQLAADRVSLAEMLTHVAEFAVRAIPGADGAGLALLQDQKAESVVRTHEFVRRVDDIQYGLDEGPCITAVRERRTVRSGCLDADERWPRFGAEVARLGVHSALSLPLVVTGRPVAAINVYAHGDEAFDARAAHLAELFAVPAATSIHDARALSEARTLAAQLQCALNSRAVIDQALGIVMSRTGCTDQEAFDQLRATSQSRNIRLSVVANQLVSEAVRRAHARH